MENSDRTRVISDSIVVSVPSGGISGDALRRGIKAAEEAMRPFFWWGSNPAVVAADYARSMGHEVDPAAALKAEHLCNEQVGHVTPPETAMQRAQRMLQSEAARMLAAETAKPMSEAPTIYGKGFTGAVLDEWPTIGKSFPQDMLQMLAASPRVKMERSPEGNLVFTLPAVDASDLDDEGTDDIYSTGVLVNPDESTFKCFLHTADEVMEDAVHCGEVRGDAYHSRLPLPSFTVRVNGMPINTYTVDGIPMAAATVQRSDLLHGALAKVEASARDVPVEAREGARISDMAGIAQASAPKLFCVPVLRNGEFVEVYGDTQDEARARARQLIAQSPERKAGVKEAITGLTTAASGDHRFGRWGAIE